MKNLETIFTENQEAKFQSEQFNIWRVTNRNHWELCFTGSREECDKEFEEMEYDNVNEEIHSNKVIDQWENEVEGRGYVTFSNDVTIDYSL